MVGVAGPSPDWTMSRANKIVRFILTALQLLGVTGAFVLNDLSHKKVGVNHHVVYRKQQYMQTLLDAEHRLVYGFLLGLFLAVMVVFLTRHRERKYWKAVLPLTLITIVTGLFLLLPAAHAMPAYVYILFLLVIIWGLEAIKTLMRLYLLRQ